MLEERATKFGERMRRVRQEPFGRLRVAPQPAAPFYFRITRRYELEMVKVEVTNRLQRIAPHLGVALLVMLVDAGLITQTRKEKMRRDQTRRNLAGDTSTRMYEIALDAPSLARQCLFYQTVSGFLGAVDDTLETLSRSAEWPAYE